MINATTVRLYAAVDQLIEAEDHCLLDGQLERAKAIRDRAQEQINRIHEQIGDREHD